MKKVRISEGLLTWYKMGDEPWAPFESKVGRLIFRVYPYARDRWKWGVYDPKDSVLAGPVFDPPDRVAESYWWRSHTFAMKKAEQFYVYLRDRGTPTP